MARLGAAGNATGQKSLNKLEMTRRQVEEFLGRDSDSDLLNMVLPEFVERYCRHLIETAPPMTKPATIDGWFENLHRIVRSAIRAGFLPDLDVFPQIRLKFADSLGIELTTARKSYKIQAHNFHAAVEDLIRNVSSDPGRFANNNGKWNPRASVLYYLAAINLGATNIEDIIEMEYCDDNHLEVNVAGNIVPINDIVADLATIHNGSAARNRHVFNIERNYSGATPEDIAALIRRDLPKTLKELGVDLYRSRSLLSDHLGYRLCTGMDAESARRAIRKYLEGRNAEKAMLADIDPEGRLERRWRVLCSYRPGLHAHKLEKQVEDLGIAGVTTYAPLDIRMSRRGGRLVKQRRPGVGRYLFVRSNAATARAIDSSLHDASFLRRSDDRRRAAVVPQAEITRMQAFLHDFRDGNAGLVDADTWLAEHESTLTPGRMVRILNGPFNGYEGIIVDKRTQASSTDAPDASFGSVIIVRLRSAANLAIAANISLALTPLELENL